MTGRRRAAVALVLAGCLVVGCTESQDPGVEPAGDQPATTSNTLGQCPPGGPDATTPPAGCLDADGRVVTP